jgi:two-component system cell cycle sensor histidine kinase/response regulator CckA
LSLLAVLELDLSGGRMQPVWRAGGPQRQVSMEEFEALARGQAVPLQVLPRLAQGADALLLIEGPMPGDEILAALRQRLEGALTEDRRDRLARWVWAAVEQGADAIELTDRQGRLFHVNAAWERFCGWGREEVVGRTVGSVLRDPVQPVHDPAFYQFTMARLHEGKPWLGTLACRTRDGARVFCEVHVSPFGEPAQLEGHFAVRRDIAHRVERDEALAVAHSQFRSVLAALPDGAAVLREDRVYFANAAFLAMVRRDEESVIGRLYLDFIAPEDRAVLQRAPDNEIVRVRVITSDGSMRIAEISKAGAVSFEGRPSVILTSRDTTDHRLAQEQLARAEKLSALGALAAGVAHELNNPLGYVVLNLELVRERAETRLDEQTSEVLREGIDGVKRIQRIVAELRGYTGSDGPGPPEPVEVATAVTSALNITQNEIRHRARLERQHQDGLFVLARKGQLVQVLVNVLTNAAQAIPEHDGREHHITVRSAPRADGMVEIVVTDTGSGIPADKLPHLFAPFTGGRGVGMGLAICKRIVDDLGGQLSLSSSLGQGTSVTIALPRTAPEGPWDRGLATQTPAPERRRLRVLVVDDEQPLARALSRVLRSHEVVTSHDGQSALAAMLDPEQSFDVVLCDLMMPGLSGSDLFLEACRQRPELASRFVFMTGGAFTEGGRAFLEKLGASVLAKPFDPAQVLRRVEEVAGLGDGAKPKS